MTLAQQVRFPTTQRDGPRQDAPIVLGYVAFAIMLMIIVYLDALSPGTISTDLATMTVFP
ncbi:hypothetical protein XH92_17270 [Bradyrhizobium sp. CCBAU 53421]|nr:hypothetical protein XH92_17270 [Bradyrhizobium sp. CCBAU 53421]